ncbi:MAG TPA: ATP-binding protein [Candidatus Angelobacter sp.]|nr:ATP-binding protein [Candidatus Angelobacter sp.]
MRDFYLLLNTAIAIALFVLGVATSINNRKPLVNKLFLVFTSSVGIWLVAACVSNDTRNSATISLYGNYLVFFFSYVSAYLLLWFAVLVTAIKPANKWMRILNTPLILVGILSATPLVVAGVESQQDVYAINFGPLIWLYALFLVVQLVAVIWIFSISLKTTVGRKRAQIKVIWQSLIVAIPILMITQFIAPAITGSFEITDAGILIMVLPVVSLYLSVIRHGLFDIRQAIIRTVTYLLSLATLSFIYYYLAYLGSIVLFKGSVVSGVSVSPVNIVMALILAFLFQPVRRFFDKVTNRVFYKDIYNSDDFFARLNKTLGFTTNLRGLLERTAYEIGNTLKSEQAFFFVNTANGHYVSAGTENHKQLPKNDADQLEGVNNKSHGVIVASLREPNDPTRRLMLSHRIELILPLVQGDETIGYLCLGDHLNSGYTTRDMRVLSTISDELTIAIQNALAVQEIRELNLTLQQRVANATKELRTSNTILRRLDKAKDEFVSMASHQLRTPLTSVKGYISMVIEGDAGKISDPQKKLLDEAFNSSERMVHLINDFLNVSRIQNGKFIIDKHPTDLSKVIGQEIDSLKPSALSRNLKFVYNPPKDFPMIEIDEGKVRQVVINFADNALYYSHENTTINISLSIENNKALFTVKDNGIGVPTDEQEQLFSKFYRASNARKQRPDGTGVGLYLAKKIIDAHEGEIVFESVEGKGSTFGFRLPLK